MLGNERRWFIFLNPHPIFIQNNINNKLSSSSLHTSRRKETCRFWWLGAIHQKAGRWRTEDNRWRRQWWQWILSGSRADCNSSLPAFCSQHWTIQGGERSRKSCAIAVPFTIAKFFVLLCFLSIGFFLRLIFVYWAILLCFWSCVWRIWITDEEIRLYTGSTVTCNWPSRGFPPVARTRNSPAAMVCSSDWTPEACSPCWRMSILAGREKWTCFVAINLHQPTSFVPNQWLSLLTIRLYL